MPGSASAGSRLVPALLFFFLIAGGCAGRSGLALPDGPGSPWPGYGTTLDSAVDRCRRVRTMELSMAISGRVGDSSLRGDVLGALARPGSLRLIGVAPFGPPGFELIIGDDSAVLLLPRDRRVVRDGSGEELLRAVAGLPLEAADFRAVLTGCVVPDPRPMSGRIYPNGWIGIEVEGDAHVYVRTVDGEPTVVAGRRPGLQVEYADHLGGLPRRVHVIVSDGTGLRTDLTARLSQVNINIELHPEVFVARVRDDFMPLTLDQLRPSEGPLRDPSPVP